MEKTNKRVLWGNDDIGHEEAIDKKIEVRKRMRPKDRLLHISMESLSEMIGLDDHEYTIVSGYWDHERDCLSLIVTNPHLIHLHEDAKNEPHTIGVVTTKNDMASVLSSNTEHENSLKESVREAQRQ